MFNPLKGILLVCLDQLRLIKLLDNMVGDLSPTVKVYKPMHFMKLFKKVLYPNLMFLLLADVGFITYTSKR